MSFAKPHPSQRKERAQSSASPEVIDQIKHRKWVERNQEALHEHRKAIARTGLAGAEFDRI